MAGTKNKPSTGDDDELLLLYDVRALTVQCCKSIPAAERLIIRYARRGHFKRYAFTGGTGIDPRHWGALHPQFGFCVPVDFDNSTVMCIREEPSSETVKLRLEEVKENLEEFAREELGSLHLRLKSAEQGQPDRNLILAAPPILPPPVVQMHLVRLARSEVLSMLRAEGFSLEMAPLARPTVLAKQQPSGSKAISPQPSEPDSLKSWVLNEMSNDAPRRGERNYARKLWKRYDKKNMTEDERDALLKSIGNYVSAHRKDYEIS
jgi:hypothetical protein